LSFKQTIALGATASFIGSVFFALWSYLGGIIQENPEILNFLST